jgi:hypothetical protein
MMNMTSYKTEPMEKYSDSFNFLVGTTNKSIDLFDNPYISFDVFEIDQNFKPY